MGLIEKLKKINYDNVIYFSLLLFSFSLGFGHIKTTAKALFLLAILSLFRFKRYRKIERKDFRFQYYLFFIFFFIITIFSIIYDETSIISKNLSLILFPIVIGIINKDLFNKKTEYRSYIALTFSLGLIAYPLLVIIYYMVSKAPVETGVALNIFSLYEIKRALFTKNDLGLYFHNVYYSSYSIFSITLLFLISFKNRLIERYKYVLIFFHILLIFIAAARLPIFIGFLVFGILTFMKIKSTKKRIILLLSIILVSTFTFTKYKYIRYKFVKDLPIAFERRINVWTNSIECIKENPFGNGIKGFHNCLYEKNLYSFSGDEKTSKVNAHNQYLNYFGGYGILGILFFLFLLTYLIAIAIKNKNDIVTILLIILFLSFLTESWLQRQYGLVFFMFFITIFSLEDEKSIT